MCRTSRHRRVLTPLPQLSQCNASSAAILLRPAVALHCVQWLLQFFQIMLCTRNLRVSSCLTGLGFCQLSNCCGRRCRHCLVCTECCCLLLPKPLEQSGFLILQLVQLEPGKRQACLGKAQKNGQRDGLPVASVGGQHVCYPGKMLISE